MSKYKVSIKSSAQKTFLHLSKEFQQELIDAFLKLSLNPYIRDLSIKKLSGFKDAYRMRIGRWRVLYNVNDKKFIIEIIDIFIHKEENDYRRRL